MTPRQQRINLFVLMLVFFGLLGYVLFVQPQRLAQPSDPAPAPTTLAQNSVDDLLSAVPQEAGVIRQLFDWPPDAIQSMQVEAVQDGSTMTLVRTTEGWQMVEIDQAIDQDVAESLATTAAILPYVQQIQNADETAFASYGLTTETLQILIKVILEDGTQHGVAVGYPTADGFGFYAVVDEREAVYVVPREPINFLAVYLRQSIASD